MGKVIMGFTMSLGGFVNNQNGSVKRLYPDLDTLRYAKHLQVAMKPDESLLLLDSPFIRILPPFTTISTAFL
jgi:hypothetical protein